VVACVAQAALEVDGGEPHEPLPGYLIEENMWRAIRNGLDGRMIDFERGVEYDRARSSSACWNGPRRRAPSSPRCHGWPSGRNGFPASSAR